MIRRADRNRDFPSSPSKKKLCAMKVTKCVGSPGNCVGKTRERLPVISTFLLDDSESYNTASWLLLAGVAKLENATPCWSATPCWNITM